MLSLRPTERLPRQDSIVKFGTRSCREYVDMTLWHAIRLRYFGDIVHVDICCAGRHAERTLSGRGCVGEVGQAQLLQGGGASVVCQQVRATCYRNGMHAPGL